MQFCSEYGYDYGFNGSDEEDFEDAYQATKKKIRKLDTNIISVTFDQLLNPNEMFAGEPKMCKKCAAVMSHLSAAHVTNEGEKKIWTCEFCNEENDVTNILDDTNELPTKDDVTFLIDVPATLKSEDKKSCDMKPNSNDDSYITFTLDISSSMDTPILPDGEPWWRMDNYPNAMTRLDCVKVSCFETLTNLKESEPHKRVSLVTFSDDVKFYGDCTQGQHHLFQYDERPTLRLFQEQQQPNQMAFPNQFENIFGSISSSNSNNAVPQVHPQAQPEQPPNEYPQEREKRKIIEAAEGLDGNLKGIKDTYNQLEQKIKFLRTECSTALGPALLLSIAFASKLPGSSVILCTDGCANVGIGSLYNVAEAQKFYDEIADYAKDKGVTVNVISMQGTDCKLAILGRVADKTNGALSIVNPLDLSKEFSSILQNKVVATNVEAKLIVNHKYLYIRNGKLEAEEADAIDKNDAKLKEELLAKRQSVHARSVGNASVDTEITFEYGVRKLNHNDAAKKERSLTTMPFQLQIAYTAKDGSKALRVFTKQQRFTNNRVQAEKAMASKDIYFVHAAQNVSTQMLHKNLFGTLYRATAQRNFLTRNNIQDESKEYKTLESNVMQIKQQLQLQQKSQPQQQPNQMVFSKQPQQQQPNQIVFQKQPQQQQPNQMVFSKQPQQQQQNQQLSAFSFSDSQAQLFFSNAKTSRSKAAKK